MARADEKHERIRREDGDEYEERQGEISPNVPVPREEPEEGEVPALTEPGAEQ
ncbi:MAG TPA: hypothetical protein VGM80_12260 [Gaiellaceae bacterium]|jgi:hypothetical protein